jgi:hypothetical protein
MRHPTTTLFAALDVFNGAVLAEHKPRHFIRRSWHFCAPSTGRCLSSWTSTASWTTTPGYGDDGVLNAAKV